jgi:hypothetical protein
MFSLILNVIVLNTHGADIRIESEMPKWVNKKLIIYSFLE